MKTSVKILVYISTLIATIIITAVTTYYLTTQVFNPAGPGGNGNTNPVNIAADTKVFWNGKDITATWTHNIKYDGLDPEFQAAGIGPTDDYKPELYAPSADFAGVQLSAGATPSVDTSNTIALLWTFDDQPFAYAQNGKTIKSISFSGLSDDALVALTLDGVILRVTAENAARYLACEIKDSRGVTNSITWSLNVTV